MTSQSTTWHDGFAAHRIRAVLLDLDGTMLDTIADLAAAANAVRRDFNQAELPLQRIATFVGKGADVLVHRTLTDSADGRLPNDHFKAARASFDKHYWIENGRAASLYDGVLAGLKKMQIGGLRLACVTNKPQIFTDALLKRQNLTAYFEMIIGGDALADRKPDPIQLLHVAKTMNLEPAQCLMVGDSVNDALAARAAGMPVLLVPYGYNEGHDVALLDSDGIVASLLEIAEQLG